MRTAVLVPVAALIACSGPAPAPASTTSIAPTPVLPPPPSSTVETLQADFMSAPNDQLDECMTIRVTFTIPPGEAWRPRPIAHDALGDAATFIPRGCDEQFRGRTVLATCVYGIDAIIAASHDRDAGPDAPPPMPTTCTRDGELRERMYDFGTALANTQRMTACIRDGGRWDAIAEDSPQYLAAQADFHAREAQRRLDQLRHR